MASARLNLSVIYGPGIRRPALLSFQWARWLANARSERDGLTPCYQGAKGELAPVDGECEGWRLLTLEEHAALVGDMATLVPPAPVDESGGCYGALADLGVCYRCTCDGPRDVGGSAPNSFGLRDVLGNAPEWVDLPGRPDQGVTAGGSWKSKPEALLDWSEAPPPTDGGYGPRAGVRLARTLAGPSL